MAIAGTPQYAALRIFAYLIMLVGILAAAFGVFTLARAAHVSTPEGIAESVQEQAKPPKPPNSVAGDFAKELEASMEKANKELAAGEEVFAKAMADAQRRVLLIEGLGLVGGGIFIVGWGLLVAAFRDIAINSYIIAEA